MGELVLIIDDYARVRKSLRDLFESVGFTCHEAENGAEAVKHASDVKPDIIILDFSMPRMNGLEAAPLLRKSLPRTPIILYSVHTNQTLANLATNGVISAVVSKQE